MSELGFRFIGHPMIDVGVATLCAAAGVDTPEKLTKAHIEDFSEYVINHYINSNLAGFLGSSVFPNARFANPAQLSMDTEPKRKQILKALFDLWKTNAPIPDKETPAKDGETCVFSNDPAVIRVSGMYIPGLTDETKINFMPQGKTKLPISGWCLFAILVMPMSGVIAEGQLMVVTAPNGKTMIDIAEANLTKNRKVMALDSSAPRPSYAFAKSEFISRLLSLFRKYAVVGSLTAYRFSASPDPSRGKITIEHLPSNVIRFVSRAQREFPTAWNAIVKKANWLGKNEYKIDPKGKKNTYLQGNYLYEDLWNLPHQSKHFLDIYLLRKRRKGNDDKNDPRFGYGLKTDFHLISWGLTELFLKEITGMNERRIDAIRDLADSLANYIREENKPKILKEIFEARDDNSFRKIVKRIPFETGGLHVGFDQFVDVYYHRDDMGNWRTDWRLARDLLVIRMLEKLREDGWFSENEAILTELATEEVEVGADPNSEDSDIEV
ncbi:MAG: hypothetical protein MUF87_08930 [Anaerolineae bacterium]|jgi:CRISPR-associated protein Cst1|nr:hypothetical protein [Anaerolineae bacterium]